MSLDTQDLARALTALNALIAAAGNAAQLRQTIANAVAEGRDISDEELAQADAELGDAIDRAQET